MCQLNFGRFNGRFVTYRLTKRKATYLGFVNGEALFRIGQKTSGKFPLKIEVSDMGEAVTVNLPHEVARDVEPGSLELYHVPRMTRMFLLIMRVLAGKPPLAPNQEAETSNKEVQESFTEFLNVGFVSQGVAT